MRAWTSSLLAVLPWLPPADLPRAPVLPCAVAVEVQDSGRALHLASTVRMPGSFAPSRRGRYHLDVARGWIYHGGYEQALTELERAERIAPLLVRNNPVARAAVRSLLSHERRSQRERLRRIAHRMHVA